jgi:hypothetical protein
MPRRVFHPLVVLSVFISGPALTIIQPKLALAASPEAPSLLISQRAPGERPLLMVVGVAHFDNPARDVVNTKVDNVLTPTPATLLIALGPTNSPATSGTNSDFGWRLSFNYRGWTPSIGWMSHLARTRTTTLSLMRPPQKQKRDWRRCAIRRRARRKVPC